MSEPLGEKKKDDRREPRALPTMRDTAQEKPPVKDRDYTRAARGLLFAGGGSVLIAASIVIYSSMPQAQKAQVGNDFASFTSRLGLSPLELILGIVVVGISGVVIFAVVSRMKRRIVKPEAPLPPPQTAIPNSQPAKSILQQAKEHVGEKPEPKGRGARCLLCGTRFRFEIDSWLDLFLHLKEHLKELDSLFEELPDREFASQLLEKWFAEE